MHAAFQLFRRVFGRNNNSAIESNDLDQNENAENLNRNNSEQHEEDDNLAELALIKARSQRNRRQSVSAESFDPSKHNEDDDKNIPVYDKTDEEMERLKESMQKALILRSLDPAQSLKVAKAVHPITVKAGEVVIKEGDEEADSFYVIESGILDVYKLLKQDDGSMEDKKVFEYVEGGSFGELALLYNQPRAATVKARVESKLWVLDRRTFQGIVVRAAYKKRQLYMDIMEKIDFLSELTSYEKQNLCDALQPRWLTDDQTIIKQNDEADGMYFIEEGKCRVTRSSSKDGTEQEVGLLGRGDYFGELALITNNPRAATVSNVGPVKLAFLDPAAFERLCGPCLQVMKRNITKYEKQLSEIGIDASLS